MLELIQKPKLSAIGDRFQFDPANHIGRLDGVVWPSVTQLLKQNNLINFDGIPKAVLSAKSLLGTRVHHATGLIDDCELDEDHFNANFQECVPYLEAYRKFRVIENFESGAKLGRLVSLLWQFHGELDEHGFHVGNFGNEPTIIDYKCTWTMYPATGPQLSAYEILLLENFGIKIKKRFGLQLKPNGNYELYPYADPTDRDDFLACVHLHWKRRNKYKTLKGEFYGLTND